MLGICTRVLEKEHNNIIRFGRFLMRQIKIISTVVDASDFSIFTYLPITLSIILYQPTTLIENYFIILLDPIEQIKNVFNVSTYCIIILLSTIVIIYRRFNLVVDIVLRIYRDQLPINIIVLIKFSDTRTHICKLIP